jgi:hypothetical protein
MSLPEHPNSSGRMHIKSVGDLDASSSAPCRYTSQYSVPVAARHSNYHAQLKRASSNSDGLLGGMNREERYNAQPPPRYNKRRRASENVSEHHHRSNSEEYFAHSVGSPSSSLRGSNGNLGPWNG